MRSPRPYSCSKSSSSSYTLAPTSLQNRLLTVFKKAQELTTLCDIEACVIHYGPDGELRTWPENRDKVRDLALVYIQLDEAKRRKKSVNLYEFLNKKKKTMTNSFKKAKRNVEELKYPISDHYSVDQINLLIQSLEQSYSKLQERRRSLSAKANLEDHQQFLNPSHFTKYSQESWVYDQNNNNNNFQHICLPDCSAVQESGLHCQFVPYGGYYDQNMCTGNNFQDPCISNIQDYSVFPLELQEPVSNYGLNQLMQHELFGFDQNLCMSDTTNTNNVLDSFLSDDSCFDFQDSYVGNPSLSQDFPDMSSSYVYDNRLLHGSTLPSL